jgi:hypothetical protein
MFRLASDAFLDKKQMVLSNLTIDMLADEIGVSRRTIERALVDGLIVPATMKGRSVRFSRQYADQLKLRAKIAREKGFKYVIAIAAQPVPSIARSASANRGRPAPRSGWQGRYGSDSTLSGAGVATGNG